MIIHGNTRSVAIDNSKDLRKGYIESLRKHGEIKWPGLKRPGL
jgi:predicted RNase H-like HicB family nuclease